ncbi:alpha/beta hydrolase [Geodermatophilus sp. SYSU D00815]
MDRDDTPGARPPRRRRRRVAVALAVVLLLAGAGFGAAAFYFAGTIEAEAFTPESPGATPEYDLVVTAYADGAVVLRHGGAAPDDDPLRDAAVYGLVWPGGAGALSGAPVEQDGGVRRALRVTAGAPPAAGTGAALSIDVWADPTAAYGTPFRDVAYPCADAECPAWWVPGSSTTWMVMVHGKGAERAEPLRALGPAVAAGLPALVISYRNDPGAPADPSGRYGYGATEWRDLEAAVAFAVDHGARDVVLFGSSMGGAIVASFLQHSPSADLVRGVVLDSPMLDLRAVVEHAAHQTVLPVLGLPVPDVLTGAAEWIAGWRDDLDWNALDYVPGDWLTVPALVFHGTGDETVPISVSEELRDGAPDLVELVAVDGAGHVGSWNADPAAYADREAAFLGCVTAAVPSC